MDNNYLPISQLYLLAPQEIENFRRERYRGDLMSVPLTDFSGEDRTRVHLIYTALGDLQEKFHQRTISDPELKEMVMGWSCDEVAQAAERLGEDSRANGGSVAQVVHDIRGGALTTLLMKLSLFELRPPSTGELQSIYFYARDHRKMMRNGVQGLDPEAEERDATARSHSIQLLKEKWLGQTHHMKTRAAKITFSSTFDGSIAERCLEFSALDRIIYNLINNATRFAADGQIQFVILPLPQAKPSHLRFVISNKITPAHAMRLQEKFGTNPGQVFAGGYSTDSTGQGMNICAEFVRNAYGLPNVKEAIRNGYVGAKIQDELWIAWFHWPIVG